MNARRAELVHVVSAHGGHVVVGQHIKPLSYSTMSFTPGNPSSAHSMFAHRRVVPEP